ncbi:serine hydrolase [Chitinophaga sp. HK235]|uniref:serine hydrolase domain-containing protein n=1 Tax=Chitinophaga sp. HK235 TaxID=2952571 RepID=UPI001BA8E976|nr:serine hydrolase [Chitinophaga sp. HK235]
MRLLLTIICLLLCQYVRVHAQTGNTPFLYAGRIVFTSENISPSSLKTTAFLSTYHLTHKSNLFFTAYADSPLVRYLHQLEPEAGTEELLQRGNYQFTLYLDNRQVYQSNLHPGAPSAEAKKTETIISKPLIDNTTPSMLWSQYFWMRFLANGGDNALTEGPHQLRMEIRPYIRDKNEVIKTGVLIAAGELPLTVKRRPDINLQTITLHTPPPYQGFPLSHESFDHNKIKLLKGYIDEGVFKNITSIAVIKNGQLLIEEYFNGSGRDSLHDVRSVGKSFAAAIMGMALKDGYLKSEEQPLHDFYDLKTFAHYSPEKERITLKALLTMSSPLDGDDNDNDSPGNEENMYPTDNWVKFTLDLPYNRSRKPGEWHYFTAGVVVLGDILHQRIPGGLEQYADRRLFRPLGITHYQWQYTPQGVASTAGGIRMNTLDFAKFGQLYQNNGRWQHQSILPASWVQKTFTRYASIPERNQEYYGYLFWNKTFHIHNKNYETYYCSGNGGNYIFVFKEVPLVIVVTAEAYNKPYAHPQVNTIMEQYLLPALLP